jgi:hypothetical protein
LSLSEQLRTATRVRVPGSPPSAARAAEALSNMRSSTTAWAMAIYAATRVISVITFAFLLPHGHFRRIHSDIWGFLTRHDDAAWYANIAQHGYPQSGPGFFHFYPGYPAAIDTIAWIPGVGVARAGMAVTAVAGLAAAAGLARLGMRLTDDARISLLLVALWAVAPGAMVLSMAYSEALMCAFAVWALVAVVDRRWITAGVLTMLGGAVHSSAVALIAAVEVAVLIALVGAVRAARTERPPLGVWLRPVAAGVMAPLGLIGFWVFVMLRQAQSGGWIADEETSGTVIDWGRSNLRVVSRAFVGSPRGIILLFVLVLLAAVALAAWNFTERMPAYLKVYILVTVLLAVLTSSTFLGSKPRILLPALLLGFPLAKVLAPVRAYVLVPMIAILAVASAWLTLYAAVMGIVP